MSTRTLWAHAVFALLALGFAWFMGQRVEDKQGGPTSVTLLDAERGDVVKVAYTWPRGTSTVVSTGSGAERMAVVDLARTIEAPKAKADKPTEKTDAGPVDAAPTDAGPAGAPADDGVAERREEARFPAGKAVMSAVEALEPLRTRRTFGEVDATRLKAMGLDAPGRHLTVTTKNGRTLELDVGEASYGGQGRYVRVKGDSVVHLVDGVLGTGFEGAAETMAEKRALAAGPEEIEGYTVRWGDKQNAFVQRDRAQAAKRRFVAPTAASDAAGDERAAKLMTTVRSLRGQKLVLDAGVAATPVASFQVNVAGRGKPVLIDVAERADGAGHLLVVDGWRFELSETQGKELFDDLGALFDA